MLIADPALIQAGQTKGQGGGFADSVTENNPPDGEWVVAVPVPAEATGAGITRSSGAGLCSTASIGVGETTLEGGIWEPEGTPFGYIFAGQGAQFGYPGLNGGAACHFTGGYVDDVSFPSQGSSTEPDNCHAQGSQQDPNGPAVSETWTASLTESVSLTSPGFTGPNFNKVKLAAENDLRNHAVPNAEQFCLPFAGSLGLAGAGVLVLPLGPAGGILASAGSLTASTLSPFCLATITRLVNDYATFRDPPLRSVNVLAKPTAAKGPKLPSCNRYHGRAGSFCRRLRSADVKLITTSQTVASITGAIEKTVSREHAASLAHNRSAARSQDAHLGKLAGQERSAFAAEQGAGRRVARLFKGTHVRFGLNNTQSGKAIALVRRDLARHHITSAKLRSVDAAALTPAPTNLLTDLNHL